MAVKVSRIVYSHTFWSSWLHPQIQEVIAYNTILCETLFHCVLLFILLLFYLYMSCHINLCVTFQMYVWVDQTVYKGMSQVLTFLLTTLINRFDTVSAYMRKMDHYGLSDF